MSPNRWYSKGLRFDCSACGRCCENHGEYAFVYLTRRDVEALAGYLGLSRAEFLERHTELDGDWIVLRTDSPACPFLGEDRRCRVYPARPKQCSTWPFWRENLDRATWEGPVKAICPGAGTGTLHPAEEVDRVADGNEAWYAAEE